MHAKKQTFVYIAKEKDLTTTNTYCYAQNKKQQKLYISKLYSKQTTLGKIIFDCTVLVARENDVMKQYKTAVCNMKSKDKNKK